MLFAIGAAIVLAFGGAVAIKKIGIPQTLGFMLAGIILGLVGIASEEVVSSLRIIVSLALGLIGYNIGHELKSEELLGGRVKKLVVIVIIEATAAFWVVTMVLYLIVNQWHIAMLFGAVASATAPAATADVVWEHDTKGPLSSSLMFVLAADDIVAVILTNSAIAYALWVFQPGSSDLLTVLLFPIIEIGGAALLGAVFGFLFLKAINRESDRGKLLEFELGLVILLIGLSLVLGLSEIFASMVFGYIVGKNISDDLEPVPALLQRIMSPIIMIFFVLVGARMAHLLTAESLIIMIIIAAVLYLVGRTIAKYVGATIGAAVVGEDVKLRKYLGTCLFCQAGVALGLSFVIEESFVSLGGVAAQAGSLILGVVAVSTIVLEAIGPLAVKESLKRSGELPDDHVFLEPRAFDIDVTAEWTDSVEFLRRCRDCPAGQAMSDRQQLSDTEEDYLVEES